MALNCLISLENQMNYKDMLDLKMAEEIKDMDFQPLIDAVNALKQGSYWQSKNERLTTLIDSTDIAVILTKATVGFDMQIQELVGILARQISKGIKYEDMIRNASDVIAACDDIIYKLVIREHLIVESFYRLEPETYEYIGLATFSPPMVVEPKQWVSNNEGALYDTDIHCILGSKLNRHNREQALDVLNLLQNIAWELDPVISKMEQEPNKQLKSPDSHEQFKTFKKECQEVYEKYMNKPFWFMVQFDKRGRMYTKGYHIQFQGSGWHKASLNFSKKELITGDL